MTPYSQLIYCSRRNPSSDHEAKSEVRDILATARESNPERGITGALLADADCFAQVLEGPAASVEALFDRIRVDPRHHSVVRLLTRTAPERVFPDWSMGFTLLDDADEIERATQVFEQAFLAAADSPDAHAAGTSVYELIKSGIGKAQIW